MPRRTLPPSFVPVSPARSTLLEHNLRLQGCALVATHPPTARTRVEDRKYMCMLTDAGSTHLQSSLALHLLRLLQPLFGGVHCGRYVSGSFLKPVVMRPAIPRFRACHFVHDYHSAFGFIIGDVTSPSLRAMQTSEVLPISGGRRLCGRAVVSILKVRDGFRASISSNSIIYHELKCWYFHGHLKFLLYKRTWIQYSVERFQQICFPLFLFLLLIPSTSNIKQFHCQLSWWYALLIQLEKCTEKVFNESEGVESFNEVNNM